VAAVCTVVVPETARPHAAALPERFEPVYYRPGAVSLLRRLQGRLHIAADQDPFAGKILLSTDPARITDARALWLLPELTLSRAETQRLLARMPRLEWVYSQKTGVDLLSGDLYAARGVKVSNTGSLVSAWVAQMNFACIVSHSKQLPSHVLMSHRLRARSLHCHDFAGQTVAIVGTGNTGRETGALCRAVGMHVVGLSRRPGAVADPRSYDVLCSLDTELDAVLVRADYVVIALPLNEQTCRLIDARRLALMKHEAALVNLSRPEIVDETALLAMLRERRDAAAYVSRLGDVSRLRRLGARRLDNLIRTHDSEAHLREKGQQAFRQFLGLLESFVDRGEVGNRVA
jgi:phosphoglycerate dehydrogenase-like enzyme